MWSNPITLNVNRNILWDIYERHLAEGRNSNGELKQQFRNEQKEEIPVISWWYKTTGLFSKVKFYPKN